MGDNPKNGVKRIVPYVFRWAYFSKRFQGGRLRFGRFDSNLLLRGHWSKFCHSPKRPATERALKKADPIRWWGPNAFRNRARISRLTERSVGGSRLEVLLGLFTFTVDLAETRLQFFQMFDQPRMVLWADQGQVGDMLGQGRLSRVDLSRLREFFRKLLELVDTFLDGLHQDRAMTSSNWLLSPTISEPKTQMIMPGNRFFFT